MTNVLFINYANFNTNSATHIFNLANRMVQHGLSCAVAVPNDKGTILTLGDAKFVPCEFAELSGDGLSPFPDGRPPDLIHAWTPREVVRKQTEVLAQRYGCPYVVHLEDNEEFIFEALTKIPLSQVSTMSDAEFEERTGDGISHPIRYRRFLSGAAGVTGIIDSLFTFVPAGIPTEEISPGYDEDLFFPQKGDVSLRKELGIEDGEYVIVYPGNAHSANASEMRSLYLAVGLVNRQGYALKLVRCGNDFVDPLLDENLQFINNNIINVGFQPHLEIPRYMALADFLVQPGRSNKFNDFRIPSKLPEFLAMGRPVILPKANIGVKMRDGVDALVMEGGHSLDIARQLCRLIQDPDLCQRLSIGGRTFAETHLNWNSSAGKLMTFYEMTLGLEIGTRRKFLQLGDSASEASLYERYKNFRAPTISYATVVDYCDSIDHLGKLGQLNADLKDVQRAWTLKALLGSVPPGARLLEIGGGDAQVAQCLVDLGYEVVIVDPYEGDAGGPNDFMRICETHPKIKFIRGLFPQGVPVELNRSFDAIFSISVLEHIPVPVIPAIFAGIQQLLRHPGCPTIHSIDHVHKGHASEYHLNMLRRVATSVGLTVSMLDGVLRVLDDDPDTYFLSAEAHNRWRGSIPYVEFPMRRVVSIQLCTPILLAPTQPPVETGRA